MRKSRLDIEKVRIEVIALFSRNATLATIVVLSCGPFAAVSFVKSVEGTKLTVP